ncbi:hypothetical protein [Streptomyces sp. NPDC059850]|uniref:hypothetical protein n=1 Tax=Streptomyces sp. NPDC059850 TaxID=3346970 RepID=UPI003667E8C4
MTTALTLMFMVGGCGLGGGDDRAARTAPSGRHEAASTPSVEVPSQERGRTGGVALDDLDQRDADAFSGGVLEALWTFDTTVDSRPHDASVRVADQGWLTKEYAARIRADRPQSVPGAQWEEWTKHRARTVVTLARAEDAAKPADTATEGWRQWEVTTSPQGRDGWAGESRTFVAYVHLTRTAAKGEWRVASIAVS